MLTIRRVDIKAVNENYIDLMINNEFASELFYDGNLTTINDRYSILHEPINEFRMCLLGNLPYTIFPLIYTLNSTFSLEKSNVPTIQRNPHFSLFGQGVLIGFVDTGIDYKHKAFLNLNGTTRIFSIWDQTLGSGIPPDGFTFGSEYKKEVINLALKSIVPSDIVPTFDDNGHGTALAGIAAGTSDPNEEFSGIAPEAELVVVKLKQAKEYNRKIFCVKNDIDCYLETDLMLGIEYVRKVAMNLNRPLVLCIGMGSSQGGHNGGGPFAEYINSLSTYPGVSVCIAAGNEGNNQRHYRGALMAPDYFKDFELRIGDHDHEFFFELWNHSPFRISIKLTAPTGETTQVIQPRFNDCRTFDFVFESTIIYVNNFILEEETGAQLIIVRFSKAMKGIWRIRVFSIDFEPSVFDVWLPSGIIISQETYFLEATPDITVTNPGNTQSSLTVAAYNQNNDSININSSRGFSISDVIVPDLAAPGYMVTCPLPYNQYGNATGTGAAAAHASGILALLLEWAINRENYTTITGRDINRLLIRGAYRSKSISYPNTTWGYGQIDILGLFHRLSL